MARWDGMRAPYRTFVLLGLAVGMLGAGYLFAPARGAMPLPPPAVAKAAPVPLAAKPASTLAATRPPVPLLTRAHTTFYTAPPEATEKASLELAVVQAPPTLSDGAPAASGDNAQAKAAIELDGYKNVGNLVKGADGVWRGRALRGRTEIAVTVDASGSVSAE